MDSNKSTNKVCYSCGMPVYVNAYSIPGGKFACCSDYCWESFVEALRIAGGSEEEMDRRMRSNNPITLDF